MENKINNSTESDYSVYEGLTIKNTLLVSGLVIAPAVTFATTIRRGLTLVLVFSVITFISIVISSFIPRKISYAVRIILYTVIAAMVYVPIYIILMQIIPLELKEMGLFAPLIITNPLIISKSELKFFRESKSRMFIDIVFYILGYDVAIILFSIVREILSTGEIGGNIYGIITVLPSLSYTFGGLILLGFLAALYRWIIYAVGRKKE